jgi:hypothetical protein
MCIKLANVAMCKLADGLQVTAPLTRDRHGSLDTIMGINSDESK